MLMSIEKVEELRDQARIFDKEGDARYQKGNLEGAKACYLEAFRLRFRLYWKGGTPEARVDMCISYVKMNRIYEESGDTDRADRLLCNAANLQSENGKALKHEGPVSIIEVKGIAPKDLADYTHKLSHEVETPIVIVIDDIFKDACEQYFFGIAMGRDDIELEKILNTSYAQKREKAKGNDFYLFILSKYKKEEFKKEVLANARALND